MKIAVLGAGAFGTALGGILIDKGYEVDYYDPKLERKELGEVLNGAKTMVLAVPSQFLPGFLPLLVKDKPLIVATKGILTDKIFAEFEDWMVLSGPGFADDIKAKKLTQLTATSPRVIEFFETDYLHFDSTNDKTGVLMCGALKNVYAIMAGILDLKPGTLEHEEFLSNVAKEMAEILKANSADPKTVQLACGVGDLRLTCYFPSRNYEFGQKLRENPNSIPEKTVEGLSALRKIVQGEILIPQNVPILEEIIKRSQEWP